MKKVFILILCCFILFSCTTKTNMTIKPATLTNEEQNILKLFDIDDSTLILDFNVDDSISNMTISFYELNNNKWKEISSSYRLINNTTGRILFKYEDLRDNIFISYQFDENYGTNLIETNIKSSIQSKTIFSIANEQEIVKDKEFILICQINSTKDNAIYMDHTSLDELAILYDSKGYEEAYIITIEFK